MITKTTKRFISLILVLCLVMSMLVFPVSATTGVSASGDTYFFKVGADTAYSDSTGKIELTEAPYVSGSNVYIPASALAKVGVTASGDVNINDISSVMSGYYASYDFSGLIAVSKSQNLFSNWSDDDKMNVMKKFLFDNISFNGSKFVNNEVFSAGSMTSTAHPYLFANQDKFDELRNAYNNPTSDPTLYSYIKSRVEVADGVYRSYATLDASGNYSTINKKAGLASGQTSLDSMPYQSGYGYDVGGRLNEAGNHNNRILSLAYAYQVTGDVKYAKLAYDYAIAMGKWEHWGPGHFLNCADASMPYATAYDWLYNVWQNNGKDVSAIETVIFTHSILPAYYSLHDVGCPWYNPAVAGFTFGNKVNNWNAVCSAGVTVAALALAGSSTKSAGTKLDVTVDGTYNATVDYSTVGLYTSTTNSTTKTASVNTSWTYSNFSAYLINQCTYNLPYYGMSQYMPDGSYIESNAYWSYGTNNVYLMAAALLGATGNDYGILDCWGMDRTAYFALNVMSSDGQSWNFHDSNITGAQDTGWFQFVGNQYGDRNLVAIRQYLVSQGISTSSIYDALYYTHVSEAEITAALNSLSTHYYMEGIDGFVVRDSWNRGGSYAGFMGETNNLGHGQIDSGSFIYYNNGTMWFADLGTENYNAYGFWGSRTRYTYYRMNAEGNNTLIVTSDQTTLPYGQALNGSGEITKTGSNEYGAWAVMDQTSVYGGLASRALRGLFMTNDRKTVVIQDQVTFTSAQSAAWIAHTRQNIMLSTDGRTAYLSDGHSAIKVTLIDNTGSNLKFTVKDYSDYYLTATVGDDFSVSQGGQPQNSNAGWRKLVVEFNGVTNIDFAVAIEEVPFGAENADEFKVGYSFTDMNGWVATSGAGSGESGSGEGETVAVGKVTVKTPHFDKPDTPVVDLPLWEENVPAISYPLGTPDSTKVDTTEYTAYSFTELIGYINGAPEDAISVTVTLYTSSTETVSIDRPCTVNTNGHSFLATSENYIAEVSGNTITYKTGSVTVSWVIGGTTYTETYTGSVSASYKGTVPASGLFEVDNGDGTYSYCIKNGWANTDGGEKLNGTGMIVTTANCKFYQANEKFDGLFVTVAKDGTVKGYYQASDLFQNPAMGTSGYKISLTDSFYYDGSGDGRTLEVSNMSLYLNGYTLEYATTEQSDHFLTTVNGANNTFKIYGPGEISSTSTSGNIIYANNGGVYAENVTFTAPREISDIRKYVSVYKNCTFNFTKNSYAFAVNNRNNAIASGAYPGLVLDGCTVNLKSTTPSAKVFQVWNNATLELIGGTSINANVNPNNILELGSIKMYASDSMNFATACTDMKVSLGEVFYPSGVNLVSSVTSDTANTYDYTGKVCYTEGAVFAEKPTVRLDDDCVVARQDNAIYPYVIAKQTNCATVVWKNGSATLATEYWVGGSTPTASDAIKNKVTVPSNQMLIFNTEAVAAGETYTITTSVIDSFGLKVNMTLEGDFRLNFYVDKLSGIKFFLDGEEVTKPETTVIDGVECYKISKVGIAPCNAGAAVNLQVVYNGVTINRNISIIDYAEKVLADENQTSEAKAMMINVVKYIDAAYVYAGKNVGATALEYRIVNSLYSAYKSLATAAVVDRANASISNVADAISNAQLNLTDKFNLRFNFKSTYTGRVSFTYTAGGTTVTRTVSVTNGQLSNGNGFVDISRKAYDMMGEISITTAGGTAVYSVSNYYHVTANELDSTTYLLNAMCAYSEAARLYKESVSN